MLAFKVHAIYKTASPLNQRLLALKKNTLLPPRKKSLIGKTRLQVAWKLRPQPRELVIL